MTIQNNDPFPTSVPRQQQRASFHSVLWPSEASVSAAFPAIKIMMQTQPHHCHSLGTCLPTQLRDRVAPRHVSLSTADSSSFRAPWGDSSARGSSTSRRSSSRQRWLLDRTVWFRGGHSSERRKEWCLQWWAKIPKSPPLGSSSYPWWR